MLQNKIYQNYLLEILKTFFVILLGLSLVALTVRAVSFLELIVDSGYLLSTYFKYSILNILGIIPKFIPLSFLLALTIFVIKHKQDSEFIILWTSGIKKINLVNLLFLFSILILLIHLITSTLITPLALNKSRNIISNNQISSVLPTVRTQQFSDSFISFTSFVEKKNGNNLENIFLHDKGNILKNLSPNVSDTQSISIIASKGTVENNRIVLFDGQIISEKKENFKDDVIKFEQLNVNLSDLNTRTIKKPKIQETSTLKLINCWIGQDSNKDFCNKSFIKELVPTLNRRIILPFYIPVISLVCCLLLIKTEKKYLNSFNIFLYSFCILLFAELSVRFTEINFVIQILFITLPIILIMMVYSFILFKFSNEYKINE
tara:strand:- start:35 stop:1162 length:1128 start_codon:yes stop_codon:yes gene_type:complete